MYNINDMYNNYYRGYNTWQNMYGYSNSFNGDINRNTTPEYIKDYGPNPLVIDIEETTDTNNNFRTALWTGNRLQVTVMSIPVGESIGLEIHPETDQFIRIEQGIGFVQMGDERTNLTFERRAFDNFAVIIPAGKWHNITNIGSVPLKVYSIYAPPNHPKGTVHKTKKDAEH